MGERLTKEQAQKRIDNIETELQEFLWPGDAPIEFSQDPETRKLQQLVIINHMTYYPGEYAYKSKYDDPENKKSKETAYSHYTEMVKRVLAGTDPMIEFINRNPQLKEEFMTDIAMSKGEPSFFAVFIDGLDPSKANLNFSFSKDDEIRSIQEALLPLQSRLTQEAIDKILNDEGPKSLPAYIKNHKELFAEVINIGGSSETKLRAKIKEIEKRKNTEEKIEDIDNELDAIIIPSAKGLSFSDDPETKKMQQMVMYYRIKKEKLSYNPKASAADRTKTVNKQIDVINDIVTGKDPLYNHVAKHPGLRQQYYFNLFSVDSSVDKLDKNLKEFNKTKIDEVLAKKEVYDKGLFGPAVASQYNYHDDVYKTGPFVQLQKLTSKIKINVPDGLSGDDVSALVFACTIGEKSVMNARKIMIETGSKGEANNKLNDTEFGIAIDTVFNGMYVSAVRHNQHDIKYVVPDARMRAKNILDLYQQGDKKLMGEVLSAAVKNTLEYCLCASEYNKAFFANAAKSLEQLTNVLQKDEFAAFNTLSDTQKKQVEAIKQRYENQIRQEKLENSVRHQIYDGCTDLQESKVTGIDKNIKSINDNAGLKKDIHDLFRATWLSVHGVSEVNEYQKCVNDKAVNRELGYRIRVQRDLTLCEKVLVISAKPDNEKTEYERELLRIVDEQIEKEIENNENYQKLMNSSFEKYEDVKVSLDEMLSSIKKTPDLNRFRSYHVFENLTFPSVVQAFIDQLKNPNIKYSDIDKEGVENLVKDLKELCKPENRLGSDPTDDELKTRIDSYRKLYQKIWGDEHKSVEVYYNYDHKADTGVIIKEKEIVSRSLETALTDAEFLLARGLDKNLDRLEVGKNLDSLFAKERFESMLKSENCEYVFYKQGEVVVNDKVYDELLNGSAIDMVVMPKGQDVGIKTSLTNVDGHIKGSPVEAIARAYGEFEPQKNQITNKAQFDGLRRLKNEINNTLEIRNWSKLDKTMTVGKQIYSKFNGEKNDYVYMQDGNKINADKAFEEIAQGREVSVRVFAKDSPFGAIVNLKTVKGVVVKEKTNEFCARKCDLRTVPDVPCCPEAQYKMMKKFKLMLDSTDPWFVKNSKSFNTVMKTLDKVIKAHEICSPSPDNQQIQSLEILYNDFDDACKEYVDIKDPKLKDNPKDERGSMRLDLIESLRSITGKDHIRTISGHSLSAVREEMTKIEKSVDYLRDFVIGDIKGALESLNEAEDGADYGKAYKEHCTQLVDYLSEHKLLGKTDTFVKASVSKDVSKLCNLFEQFNQKHPEEKIPDSTMATLKNFEKQCNQAHAEFEKMPAKNKDAANKDLKPEDVKLNTL